MPKNLLDGEPYAGRRPDIKPLNISLDREAADLVRQWAGDGGKVLGRFMSRLVFEERARREERARLRQEAVTVE
jgi:hypothetical protein